MRISATEAIQKETTATFTGNPQDAVGLTVKFNAVNTAATNVTISMNEMIKAMKQIQMDAWKKGVS